jgi:hypothetical protein
MSGYPGSVWLARYRERVNADPELAVIGDWFTCAFALTFGDDRYAVIARRGVSATSSRSRGPISG